MTDIHASDAAQTTPASPQSIGEPLDHGLSTSDAQAALLRNGANVMPSVRQTPVWRQFAAQLFHFFALMLWVAGFSSVRAIASLW